MEEWKHPDVDRGWAWVVFFASVMSNVVVGILNYSAGVIHVALLDRFGKDVASTALVGSVFTSLTCLAGPFVSLVTNITSCRVSLMIGGMLTALGYILSFFTTSLNFTLITFGVISGVGLGFSCTPCVIVTGYSFKKYRGIASGIIVGGCGVGMLAGGPLVQFTLDTYGLNGMFLMLAGIGMQNIIFGLLLRPSTLEKYHKQQRTTVEEDGNATEKCSVFKNLADTSILRNKAYLLILLSTLLWNVAYAIIMLHIAYFSVVMGSSPAQAAMLLFWIGLGSAISRIIAGLVSGGEAEIDPLLLDLGALGIVGFLTLLFPLYAQENWQRSLFACLFGIYSGGLITFIIPICIEVVGLKSLSSAIGQIWFVGGIGYAIGPTTAGLIIDKTGNYSFIFYIAGAMLTLASILVMLSSIWRPESASEIPQGETQVADLIFKGSNFLSGSGFLTGSLSLVYEINASTKSLNVPIYHSVNKDSRSVINVESAYIEEVKPLTDSNNYLA